MAHDDSSPKPSIWAWPDATLGQKAAAFVLDGLIVAGVGGLLQVLVGRFVDGFAFVAMQAFLAVLYFILMQADGRRTLGQRVAGIRLIGLQVQDIDEGIPLGSLILREALWFPLGFLFLGAGLWVMFARRDRMALYDLFSRTRVVTMSPEAGAAPVRISLVIGALTAVAVTSILAVTAVSRLTVLPVRRVIQDLELLGYKVGRVGGSRANGFTIERLSFESEEIQCEISGVRFGYKPVSGDIRGAALVSDLSIDEAKISIHKVPVGFQATLPDIKWLINAVEVRRLVVQLPDHAPFNVSRFALNNVTVDSSKKTLRLDRMWLESEALWLDLFDLVVQSHALTINKASRMQIRPVFFPDILLAPVDLAFEGAVADGQLVRVKLDAFNGLVKFGARDGSGALSVAGFSPSRFFNTGMPLDALKLRASGNLLEGEFSEVEGSVEIGGQKFTIGPDGLFLARAKKRYLIAPKISWRWREWLSGKVPAATLIADDDSGVMSHLSEIYYSRPLNELSTSELERIKREQVYFEAGPAFGSVRLPSAVPFRQENR